MNKKLVIGLVIVLFVAIILIGGNFTSEPTEASGDYDSAFYVEDNGNLFIKLAKITDQCCYFVVDIVVSGVTTIFNLILGN